MIRNTCRLGVRSRADTYFFFVLHLRHLQRPTSSLPCTSDSKNSARGMRVRAWCANTQYKGAAGRGGATRGRRQVGVRRSAYDEDCRGEKKTRVTDVCDVQVVRFRAACEMMMMMMVRRLYHGRERGDGANKGEEGCMKTRQTRQSGAYTPTDEQQTNGTTSKRHSKARPLTLAQIEDTRSQTQESKMDNLPTL